MSRYLSKVYVPRGTCADRAFGSDDKKKPSNVRVGEKGTGMTHHLRPDGVVERIYDAVSKVDMSADALNAAAEFCGADAMLLVYGNLSGGDPVVVDIGIQDRGLGQVRNEPPQGRRAGYGVHVGPVGIVISSEHRREGNFFDTSMYRRLLWPCGLRYLAGTAVINTPKGHASLWMSRSEGAGLFPGHLQRFPSSCPTSAGRWPSTTGCVWRKCRRSWRPAPSIASRWASCSSGWMAIPFWRIARLCGSPCGETGLVFCDRSLAAERPGIPNAARS